MQQNEIVDIFYDDWHHLTEDDGTFGVKSDTHLKVRVTSHATWSPHVLCRMSCAESCVASWVT